MKNYVTDVVGSASLVTGLVASRLTPPRFFNKLMPDKGASAGPPAAVLLVAALLHCLLKTLDAPTFGLPGNGL